MNDMIIYRPYRSHIWALFFTIPVGMLTFVAAGYCLQYWDFSVIFLVTIGIVSIWLSKMLYDSSNIAVFFEQEGLRIVGGSCTDYRYALWEELSYAYYIRSFKGHLFLVLSPKALGHKEAKALANRGANSAKICIDYAVVMHIDVLQNTSQLKELIDNNVLHISDY